MEVLATVAATLASAGVVGLVSFAWRQNGRITTLENCQRECRPSVLGHLQGEESRNVHTTNEWRKDISDRLKNIEMILLEWKRKNGN